MTFACYHVLQMHPDGGRAWVLSFFLLEQPITLTDDDAPGGNWGGAMDAKMPSQAPGLTDYSFG